MLRKFIYPSFLRSYPLMQCRNQSVDALKAYMRFCQKYHLHLISDEVYAMSIYKTPSNASAVPFTSALAIDTTGLIDANLIHILYGSLFQRLGLSKPN